MQPKRNVNKQQKCAARHQAPSGCVSVPSYLNLRTTWLDGSVQQTHFAMLRTVDECLGVREKFMGTIDFTHQEFRASDWENKLKEFITSLDYSDNIIWHRKREHKKINEELATLGYYVKYQYGEHENITFKLNKCQGKADGWIYDCGKKIETVQIAIAYYQQEEAEIDKRTMSGEDFVVGGWVADRIEVLKSRVEERIKKKTNMNYENIDTLLIGLRDWFVKRINNEYHEQKNNVVCNIESSVTNCTFKKIVLVDADYVGKGELLIIPNLSLSSVG